MIMDFYNSCLGHGSSVEQMYKAPADFVSWIRPKLPQDLLVVGILGTSTRATIGVSFLLLRGISGKYSGSFNILRNEWHYFYPDFKFLYIKNDQIINEKVIYFSNKTVLMFYKTRKENKQTRPKSQLGSAEQGFPCDKTQISF